MSAALKVGDIVVRTAAPDAERFIVIHGAAVPAVSWAEPHARMTSTGLYVKPAGWHVQSLDNGRLATFPAADLARVGNLIAETDGLLPRARKVVAA